MTVLKFDPFDGPVFVNSNYDSQIFAIRQLFSQQRKVAAELTEEYQKAEDFALGLSSEVDEFTNLYAADRLTDLAIDQCYQGAAHSMAAVGMVAPLIESAFKTVFSRIGKDLPRRFDFGKDIMTIVDNVRIEGIGMAEYMPDLLHPTLSALFEYRNKMFHFGFEWPLNERESFAKRLNEPGWESDWFDRSTTGNYAWMFHMSSKFASHCIDQAEQVIYGIEEFCIAVARKHNGLPPLKQGDIKRFERRLGP